MSQPKYISSLTPLRGIAALLVVLCHFHMMIGPLTSPDVFIVSKFYLMVDLFFILSGFIIVHIYGDLFIHTIEKATFWRFIKARFARIYPLHLVTFLYLLGWVLYMKSQINFEETPALVQGIADNSAIPFVLTLTHAWGTHTEATWNSASWSISVEWFLYLLFPLLAWMMYRSKPWLQGLIGVVAFAALFYISEVLAPLWSEEINLIRQRTAEELFYQTSNSIDIITGFALLRGGCSFIFGMLTYELYRRGIGQSFLKHSYWFVVIFGGLLLLWYKDWLPDPFAIPALSLLILHTAYGEGGIHKLLNGKVFTHLGNISYSIYLVHTPLIMTAFIFALLKGGMPPPPDEINYLNNWIGAFVLLIIVILIASITYRFIEKPARNKLNSL
ncbi:MAG: acyltransferase family protein [Aureispira sp.]